VVNLSSKVDPERVRVPGCNLSRDVVRSSRLAEEQIIVVLKEAEAVRAVKDLRRKHGISEQTF